MGSEDTDINAHCMSITPPLAGYRKKKADKLAPLFCEEESRVWLRDN
jgi:hypothetical protein